MNLLDRYLLRAWTKIFVATALGFPIVVTVIELSDKLSRLIDRDVPVAAILLGHVMGMPEKIFQVIPAAVLFATVFSIGSMCRHSEMVAVKASGRSFYRMLRPVLAGAAVAAALAFAIAELAPITTRRQAELLGEVRQRARNTRFNFVYRADGGWVYMMRSLDVAQGTIRQSIFVREGSGGDRPTFVLDAVAGRRNDSLAAWR
ncbi:MAG: LptF/LptG family permease, partial [Gemmatimonadales bacterium]